nr:MAG TPA: hypothetical protein [Caudoviricetes sp.]
MTLASGICSLHTRPAHTCRTLAHDSFTQKAF